MNLCPLTTQKPVSHPHRWNLTVLVKKKAMLMRQGIHMLFSFEHIGKNGSMLGVDKIILQSQSIPMCIFVSE